jgi:uncharacterized protein YprB with RNaseH-like and TPR domain
MPIKVACFDLETSGLDADFGIILCGVVKLQGEKKPIVLRADKLNKGWARGDRMNDSPLVKELKAILEEQDILVAHNAMFFDVPFMCAKCAEWGLGAFNHRKVIDPYQITRNKMRIRSKSLSNLCSHIGIKNRKTDVDGRTWKRAFLNGDTAAMDEIAHHCVIDVLMLEELLDAVKTYSREFNARGSG